MTCSNGSILLLPQSPCLTAYFTIEFGSPVAEKATRYWYDKILELAHKYKEKVRGVFANSLLLDLLCGLVPDRLDVCRQQH
jgi:hypothetical protein